MNKKISPIVVEIIRNAVNSIAAEMNTCLVKSAFGPGIFEMKDCSVGVFNRDAKIMGQSSGLPIFLGNLEICIDIVTEEIGIGGYHPGDVWVMNDPYMQGTHAADITVFAPIFYKERLEGFTAVRAAMMDMGGKDYSMSADSTDIYQEGLRIPPVRLCVEGKVNEDVMAILCQNSRLHSVMRGDLYACIAACNAGEKRMNELYERYGANVIDEAADIIFHQSEISDREEVSKIPDGEYMAEGTLDNDGITDEEKIVRVKVIVKGDHMTIDLSGSAKMAVGPINCGEAQAIAAARVGFKELINPNMSVTGGTFRNLDIIVEKGTFLAAEEPAPCGWYFTGLGLLIDLIVKALAPVMPEACAAAHYGDSNVCGINGVNALTGTRCNAGEPNAGGWGAFYGGDGQNCMINVVNGDLRNFSIEYHESFNKLSIRVLEYAVRADSEGAGKWRGGMGTIRTYRCDAVEDAYLMCWMERSKTTAWGVFGGQPGKGPVVIVNPGTPDEVRMCKTNRYPLKNGDIIMVCTGGGGGYGNPLERDRKAVKEDIDNGYISLERAREVYGYTDLG